MLKWILGFIVGCISLLFVSRTLTPSAMLGLALFSLLLLLLKARYSSTIKVKPHQKLLLVNCLSIASAFCLGFIWSNFHADWRLQQRIPQPINQTEHIIEGYIVSIPVIYDDYQKFLFRVSISDEPDLIDKKLSIKWYTNNKKQMSSNLTKPELGQLWRLKVKLKPIYGPVNLAGYDIERQLFVDGVNGQGYVKGENNLLKAATERWSLQRLRMQVYQTIDSLDNRGFFQAVLVGEKGQLSRDFYQLSTSLGLNHLLAISGLHISIVAGFMLLIASKLVGYLSSINSKVSPLAIGFVISIVSAFFYSALAGFALATLRALIMWTIVIGALLINRRIALFDSLIAALFVILLLFPLSIYSASFWLTFAAIAFIGLVTSGQLVKQAWWKSMLMVQLAMSGLMLILGIYFFQQMTLLSSLVNMIVLPIFSIIILPLILLSFLAQFVFALDWPMSLFDNSLGLLVNEGQDLLDKPWLQGLFGQQYVDSQWLLLAVILLIILLLPLGHFKLPSSFILLFALCMPLLEQGINKQQDTSYKMEVFDVGHGLAVLFYNNSHALLYDTGFARNQLSAAQIYLLPSLRKLGVKSIDILVISHSDNDHAGGYQTIIEAMPVKKVITNDSHLQVKLGTEKQNCIKGSNWSLGAMRIDALHPWQTTFAARQTNDDSCVLKVTINKLSVLLTGDIEEQVERLLASNSQVASQLKSDILIAPHHGSNTSSSYPFIKRVEPKLVIYPADLYNRYKMPHFKVQKRYQILAVEQVLVGISGQLSFDFIDKSFTAQRLKTQVWRKPIPKSYIPQLKEHE